MFCSFIGAIYRLNVQLHLQSPKINALLTEQFAEVCVVDIRILFSQPPSLSLRPDHEGVHRTSYPRLHPLRTASSLVTARRPTSRVTPRDSARRRRNPQRCPYRTDTAPSWHAAPVSCRIRGPAEDRGDDGPGHRSVRHVQLR